MGEEKKLEVAPTEEMQVGLMQNGVSLFLDAARFEFGQRVATMLSKSTMLPEQFNSVPNCMILLNLSDRMKVDPFMLAQNIYIVHNKPGIEAKLAIALFNDGRTRFKPPLQYETTGEDPKAQDYKCRAYATLKEKDEVLRGEWIDWPMVKAEGWLDKKGSKWGTMPGQMFIYRAAMFFIRAYEPGVLLGLRTKDELDDMIIDVTPIPKKIEGTGKELKGDVYAAKETSEKPKVDEVKLDDSNMTPERDETPLTEKEKTAADLEAANEKLKEKQKQDKKVQETPTPDKNDQEIIDQFKGLKTSGLIAWELENRKALKLMSEMVQMAFAQKFSRVTTRIYPEWVKEQENPHQEKTSPEDGHQGGEDNDDYPEQRWEVTMKGFIEELGLPSVNRVLARYHVKEYTEVPVEERPAVIRDLNAELDEKNQG